MINTVIEVWATVLDAVFLMWFVSKFNNTSILKKPWTLCFPIGLLAFELIADKYLLSYGILYTIGFILFISAYSFFTCNKKYKRAVLAACVFYAVIILSGALLSVVFSTLFQSVDPAIYGTDTEVRIIYLVIGKLLQFGVYKLLLRLFGVEKTLDVKSSIVVFILTLTTVCGLIPLMSISFSYESNRIHGPVLIIVAVLLVSNIVLYYLIYQVQKLLKNRYELRLLQEKMAFEKTRYEEASGVWDNIRKVRHDMKNHFAVILGYLKNNDCTSCEEYIEQIMPAIESMGNLIRSSNSVLDYLINSKLSGLNETQIIISGTIGDFNDIEDTDLASIIGNVLDNAVEAQKKVTGTKRIELLFRMMNNNRVIICKNTISESVLKNNKELRSTKKNPGDHGLGHQIVEATLKKYDGIVEYFETDDMFGVQIMIPMP